MAAQETSRKPKTSPVQLMFNSHDPLAESQRVGREQENDYFRTVEQELLAALRSQHAEEVEQAIRRYTRMRCPKCGEPLATTSSQQGALDACPGCGGIWLDKGTWEGRVGPPAQSWLQRLCTGLLVSKHASL